MKLEYFQKEKISIILLDSLYKEFLDFSHLQFAND